MKMLKKIFIFTCLPCTLIFANPDYMSIGAPKMVMNNTVLAKINDKTISVLDVEKKLNIAFQMSFPDLVDSEQSRYQFYSAGWKQTLDDLINIELMLIDAQTKQLNITDGEIREEMEKKFGPNIMISLEEKKVTYDETWDSIKNEMIVQRMMWFYVQSKAMQSITPQKIRQAYRLYCEKNPAQDIYSYQVISVKGNDAISKQIADDVCKLLKDHNSEPQLIEKEISKLEKDNIKIQISKLYTVSSKDISASHKNALSNLSINSYSNVISQTSRFDNKKINRIFYLKDIEKKEVPAFNEMTQTLKEEMLNKAMTTEAQKYFAKLRKDYLVVENEVISSSDFQPFILK